MCPAGEDLVPEPQDEVEELQREGEHTHTTPDGATDGLEPIWAGGENALTHTLTHTTPDGATDGLEPI